MSKEIDHIANNSALLDRLLVKLRRPHIDSNNALQEVNARFNYGRSTLSLDIESSGIDAPENIALKTLMETIAKESGLSNASKGKIQEGEVTSASSFFDNKNGCYIVGINYHVKPDTQAIVAAVTRLKQKADAGEAIGGFEAAQSAQVSTILEDILHTIQPFTMVASVPYLEYPNKLTMGVERYDDKKGKYVSITIEPTKDFQDRFEIHVNPPALPGFQPSSAESFFKTIPLAIAQEAGLEVIESRYGNSATEGSLTIQSDGGYSQKMRLLIALGDIEKVIDATEKLRAKTLQHSDDAKDITEGSQGRARGRGGDGGISNPRVRKPRTNRDD